jgi:hypothetical protein
MVSQVNLDSLCTSSAIQPRSEAAHARPATPPTIRYAASGE